MRDQRDPTKLGEAILALREKRKTGSLAHIVDAATGRTGPLDDIPPTRDVGPTERYGDPRRHPSG